LVLWNLWQGFMLMLDDIWRWITKKVNR